MATQEKASSNSKSFKWLSNKNLRRSLSFHSRKPSKPNSPSTLNSPKSAADNEDTKRYRSDELRQVFCRFDGDGDGKISAYELRAYFGSVGDYISQEDAQAAIVEVDSDRDGFLGFEDFFDLMTRRDLDGDGEGDLKTAFEMFELEKGSGCITPKGLQKMLNRLGEHRSYGECKAMIRVYDTDGNGVIDFHEFRQMMTA